MTVNFSSEYSILGIVIMMYLFLVYLVQIIFMTTMLDEEQVSKLQPFINIENAFVLTWWTTLLCNFVKVVCDMDGLWMYPVIGSVVGIVIGIIVIVLVVRYMKERNKRGG